MLSVVDVGSIDVELLVTAEKVLEAAAVEGDETDTVAITLEAEVDKT